MLVTLKFLASRATLGASTTGAGPATAACFLTQPIGQKGARGTSAALVKLERFLRT
jgi:hypothetical protein